MEKFNGCYKGAQVYLVPQGNDYLYKKAYTESGAKWIEEAVKQQGKPSLAEMYGNLVERLVQLVNDMKKAGGNKETAYIATLPGSAALEQVVNTVNKIINLLGANGFLSESDPDA